MSAYPSLAQTLTALVDAATPRHPALTVTEAEISLPLVVSVARGADGPVITAHPPWSMFPTGFDPVAHRARLSFREVPQEAGTDSNPAAGQNGGA
ncbi:hypothetical protein [Paracoccus sp. (in: a-proteobacteria)]|uniref:hypothetical protein n=1 Tax=Paracoccus sp. TaxID=267 RepID=UPI003A8635A9